MSPLDGFVLLVEAFFLLAGACPLACLVLRSHTKQERKDIFDGLFGCILFTGLIGMIYGGCCRRPYWPTVHGWILAVWFWFSFRAALVRSGLPQRDGEETEVKRRGRKFGEGIRRFFDS